MKTRAVLILSLLLTTTALAQGLDPLRNVSGTAASPGTQSPWLRSGTGGWTFFHGFDAHLTYVSESGPEEQRNESFLTNWLAAGVHRQFGDRGFVLLRGRVSLEPYTIEDDDGYPQMLQFVPGELGGPIIDRMRPHDLFGEAAVHVGWRPSASTLLHVYAGMVGDPALGPPPFALRASSVDFAEAPFAYEIQESWYDSTKVVTAGFASRWLSVEGSVFHDSQTFAPFTKIDSGDIDSQSLRLTLTPSPSLAIQVSRGELGEVGQRDVTSASVSYGTNFAALTALWTSREEENRETETAYGIELALQGTRNTLMGRAEWVDRPLGFPEASPTTTALEQTTHFAVGYIFDFITAPRLRAGVGVNIDYHTQSHELPERYGHKPQAIYLFLRVRNV